MTFTLITGHGKRSSMDFQELIVMLHINMVYTKMFIIRFSGLQISVLIGIFCLKMTTYYYRFVSVWQYG